MSDPYSEQNRDYDDMLANVRRELAEADELGRLRARVAELEAEARRLKAALKGEL